MSFDHDWPVYPSPEDGTELERLRDRDRRYGETVKRLKEELEKRDEQYRIALGTTGRLNADRNREHREKLQAQRDRDTAEARADSLAATLGKALSWGIELGTADPAWVAEARGALAEGKEQGS